MSAVATMPPSFVWSPPHSSRDISRVGSPRTTVKTVEFSQESSESLRSVEVADRRRHGRRPPPATRGPPGGVRPLGSLGAPDRAAQLGQP